MWRRQKVTVRSELRRLAVGLQPGEQSRPEGCIAGSDNAWRQMLSEYTEAIFIGFEERVLYHVKTSLLASFSVCPVACAIDSVVP